MHYNISAFTHIGTERELNQDRILINDQIFDSDFYHIEDQKECFCFVADGIGGGIHGEIASQFVLEEISAFKEEFMNLNEVQIKDELVNINKELISFAKSKPEYFGTGTTLTGLIITENKESLTINAGDSEIRVLRNNMFFQITEDQVLDETHAGSPLMSYFGGKENSLDLSLTSSLRNIIEKDIYVISSDGLFGSLLPKVVKEILYKDLSLPERSKLLLKTALTTGSQDNISCIIIELI